KKPGGSPFNIAIGLARLRMDVAFLVKIGDDAFGAGLREFLSSEGVDMSCVVGGAGHNTTLAMAAVNELGKPEFQFYRENSADISLTIDELPPISPQETSVFSFGSIALADNPVGDAVLCVFEKMRTNGVMTVLDPNVRPLYAEDKPIFRKRMKYLIPLVDVLKLSDDDLCWLTGSLGVEEGLAKLETNPAGLVIVTEGPRGARAIWRGETVRIPCPDVEIAETTGCGDSFIAGVISKLAPLGRSGLADMSLKFLNNTLAFANACASIVATRYGAANSMPCPAEVDDFMQTHQMGPYGVR
ncbi:MAG: carbohydrate kinase, partial [Synergistaceae bacterium]|nr:carbohydrate kinase [Synergistaceae bacterium]